MSEKITLPYGLWPSPITAGLVSTQLRLSDIYFAGDGSSLVWMEGRSTGNTLVLQPPNGPRCDLTDEIVPHGGVGYGGGDFNAAGEVILFAGANGRIYRRGLSPEPPRPITPAFGPSPAGKVASPTISPDGRWVIYVFSDGNTDVLGVADAHGAGWPAQLAHGADFYMQPAWHPNSRRIAWVEWNHPNMPWDGTRIMLADLEEGALPRLTNPKTVGGGPDFPAQQPCFSPDGRWLSFIEERGEWPDLVLVDLQTGTRRILLAADGFDFSQPAWVQGVHSTGWSADSRTILFIRYQGIHSSLWTVDIESGKTEQIDTSPYTWLTRLAVNPHGEGFACIASAPNLPSRLIHGDGQQIHPLVSSTAATYDPGCLPDAREINWQTEQGDTVYAIYSAPTHPHVTGVGLPPAIVKIHGGPTSQVGSGFNSEAAYFTSRGYAHVEVNYRGSTGYGRAYRNSLRGRWGDVDVEDAAGCARALVAQGLADPRRLVISGGSAGGYTVLNTLIRYPGLYKAGVCLYGVANLFALDLDTHKFEAHYNATLVGALPDAAEKYHAWSPVFHAGSIRDALYIFQGEEDVVVPPNQSDEIVAALRAQGVPHQYKRYPGEGHGFRKPETIADYLKETERFLQQHVLFAP